jgi:hypothetical protein
VDKDLLLEEIEKFILYHNQQNVKLDYFIEGIIDNKESVLLDIGECEMQRWLYERKIMLNNLYNLTNMNELHSHHEEWHENFEKIAIILDIRQDNKSFFQKITGKNNIKETYEKEKDKVDVYIEELKESNRLINVKLSMMRQRLLAMSIRVFNENI